MCVKLFQNNPVYILQIKVLAFYKQIIRLWHAVPILVYLKIQIQLQQKKIIKDSLEPKRSHHQTNRPIN